MATKRKTKAAKTIKSPPVFDPARALAIVFTWPDHAITWEAAAWLYGHLPPNRIFAFCGKDHQTARNEAVREIVLPRAGEIDHVILMDRDVRPGPATEPMLRTEGHVVGALYPLPDMRAWAQPDVVHLGLVRVAIEVFRRLDPPWFLRRYTADGTRWAQCECAYFAERAREAGFTVTRAGWCEHERSEGHPALQPRGA